MKSGRSLVAEAILRRVIAEIKKEYPAVLSQVVEDRGDSYGPPEENLACQAELQFVVHKYLERRARRGLKPLHPAVVGALNNIMTKVARLLVGADPGVDTWRDIFGYALCALRAWLIDRMTEEKP